MYIRPLWRRLGLNLHPSCHTLAFRASPNISLLFRGIQCSLGCTIQLKTSYQENVKGKASFASSSGHPSPLTFLSFPKDTRCQMPKNQEIQLKVAEASETLQVSTSFPPGNGKGVSQALQSFPRAWSQKAFLIGHVLEWLWESHSAVFAHSAQ